MIKDKKCRPKYAKLKIHPFIKKYEVADVNVGEWYRNASENADAVAKKGAPRYVAWLVQIFFYKFLIYYIFNSTHLSNMI